MVGIAKASSYGDHFIDNEKCEEFPEDPGSAKETHFKYEDKFSIRYAFFVIRPLTTRK